MVFTLLSLEQNLKCKESRSCQFFKKHEQLDFQNEENFFT